MRGSGSRIFALWYTQEGGAIWLSDDGVLTSDGAIFRFEGASAPVIAAGKTLPTISNFYHGNDSTTWRTGVPSYSSVTYHELYPGIDAKYYFDDSSRLEVDFVLMPGASLDCISLITNDETQAAVDKLGNISIKSRYGEFVLHKPIAEVRNLSGKLPIECTFVIDPSGDIRFAICDNIAATDTLVIDPVLTFSTYLGGHGIDVLNGIALDTISGSMFVCGTTTSYDWPIDNWIPGGSALHTWDTLGNGMDAVVTRISGDGSTLLFSTYLGGTLADGAADIAVGPDLNAYVAAWTLSTNFPYAFGTTHPGDTEIVVVRLSTTGQIVYSRYFGGSGSDLPKAIAVDYSGNAYVCGYTTSTDVWGSDLGFPTPFQNTRNSSSGIDGLLASFNTQGQTRYRTYLLGTNSVNPDVATDVVVQGDTAWVCGWTGSPGFAKTDAVAFNGVHTIYTANQDGFVMAFNPLGTNYAYGTFLGTSTGHDKAYGLTLTPDGSCWVTGETTSSALESVPIHSYDATIGSSNVTDVFVEKFSHHLNSVLAWTYLGGTGNDEGHSIAAADFGSVYVTGMTNSHTPDSFPPVYPLEEIDHNFHGDTIIGNYADGFIAQIAPEGDWLRFFSYLGGNLTDTAENIAFGNHGDAYVVGRTGSATNFPIEPGGHNYNPDVYQGNWDGFVVKCKCCPPGTMVGNVDNDPAVGVDISDLSALIDFLYVSEVAPACYDECNTDGFPGVDISDLTALIDFLYVSLIPLPMCP